MTVKLPRGVRANNPGNIDRTDIVWQGEDRSMSARDAEPRFCVFKTPEYGFRALARVLISYRNRYGLNTIREIIGRWAPPSENDTGAYIVHVAQLAGVKASDIVDVTQARFAEPIAKAIARHENGGDYWPDSVIHDGLSMAGVNP